MDTLSYATEVKANKDHRCNFCGEKINTGETYHKSTHKLDGVVYDWKTHLRCSKLASQLNMYEHAEDGGVTEEDFQETVHQQYFDLMLAQFEPEDFKKYSNVIQELRNVKFRDKLGYVVRHFIRLEKENTINT